jgi:hypothetical protein
MANLIEDTENVLTLSLMLIVVLAIGWLVWTFKDFLGLGGPADSGKLQSVKNLANGMPDGADPGTVPAAQYTQGIVESLRNFKDYVFGASEDELAQSVAPDSGKIPDNYQAPLTSEQMENEIDQAQKGLDSYVNTVRSDPAQLPFF